MCVDLCPEDAITVKGNRRGEAPEIKGAAKVDHDKCTVRIKSALNICLNFEFILCAPLFVVLAIFMEWQFPNVVSHLTALLYQ
ncbi:hypothetical protein [Methanohalophilus sp.]